MKAAKDAIAMLIDLAEKGEINPWDVQVIEVIDRFLSESKTEDRDLSDSGQAFLWASMLILLKANTLSKLSEASAVDPELILVEDCLEQEDSNLPVRLELYLRRRSAAPSMRKRRVTLDELIQQIEEIAKVLEKKPSSSPKKYRSQSRAEAAKVITQLAHAENLTEVASHLEKFLLCVSDSDIDLDDLLDLLKLEPGCDRVGVFWALLLLSSQSKVELIQNEFYDDLKIKPINGEIST